MKWFLIALMPLALAGCVTEQAPMLPMTLGPSEAAEAYCLQIEDAPTFECTAQAKTVTVQ